MDIVTRTEMDKQASRNAKRFNIALLICVICFAVALATKASSVFSRSSLTLISASVFMGIAAFASGFHFCLAAYDSEEKLKQHLCSAVWYICLAIIGFANLLGLELPGFATVIGAIAGCGALCVAVIEWHNRPSSNEAKPG